MTAAWLVALATITGLLIVGDLRRRHLDNRLVAGLALVAIVGITVIDRVDPVAVGWVVAAGAGATVVGVALYGAGLVGGGDVKVAPLALALVTRFGADAWLVYLGLVIVVGATVGVVHLRRRSPEAGTDIPLGPVLLAGLAPATGVALLVA